MSRQAEPQGQSYGIAVGCAQAYADDAGESWPPKGRSIPAESSGGSWNDRFLAGLFRYGLMLTTHEAWVLMHDDRYPGGKPMRAPTPNETDPGLWPRETWIIYRD